MNTDYISLEPQSFIAGSRQVYTFELYNFDDTEMDLKDATAILAVGNYCNPSITVLKKTANIEKNSNDVYNLVSVVLESEETKDLHGKFLFQMQISLSDNATIIPLEGILDIKSKIS